MASGSKNVYNKMRLFKGIIDRKNRGREWIEKRRDGLFVIDMNVDGCFFKKIDRSTNKSRK